jgi:hypothetical protein
MYGKKIPKMLKPFSNTLLINFLHGFPILNSCWEFSAFPGSFGLKLNGKKA